MDSISNAWDLSFSRMRRMEAKATVFHPQCTNTVEVDESVGSIYCTLQISTNDDRSWIDSLQKFACWMNIMSFSYEVSQLYSKVVILSIGINGKKYTVCVSVSFRKKNASRTRGDLCWIHSSHPFENESFGSQEMDKICVMQCHRLNARMKYQILYDV